MNALEKSNFRRVAKQARKAAMERATPTYIVKDGVVFEWSMLTIGFFVHPKLLLTNMVAMFDATGVDVMKGERHGNR